MLLEGIFIPLTTPFHPDGRLFPRKLAYNVERYSRTPAAGMFVLGDTSEADGLTDEEARMVLTMAIGAAADHKVMVACVGRESVHATLKMAEYAAEAGYDAIAVRPPTFNESYCETTESLPFEQETLLFFRALADAASLPIVLLEERCRPIRLAVVGELAKHSGIVGMVKSSSSASGAIEDLKAATADVRHEVVVTTVFAAATRRMLRSLAVASPNSLGGVAVLEDRTALKTRTKRVGFQVLGGDTAGMLAGWRNGASGALPRLAACAPQACCEVWQAFKDGDPALAEEKQDRLRAVSQLVESPRGIAKIKHGCDFNGYFGGVPRLPLLPSTAAERDEVEAELAGMRN
jgi:dihydrodipicolinate synthase/N-acetylneuraminate lyase